MPSATNPLQTPFLPPVVSSGNTENTERDPGESPGIEALAEDKPRRLISLAPSELVRMDITGQMLRMQDEGYEFVSTIPINQIEVELEGVRTIKSIDPGVITLGVRAFREDKIKGFPERLVFRVLETSGVNVDVFASNLWVSQAQVFGIWHCKRPQLAELARQIRINIPSQPFAA